MRTNRPLGNVGYQGKSKAIRWTGLPLNFGPVGSSDKTPPARRQLTFWVTNAGARSPFPTSSNSRTAIEHVAPASELVRCSSLERRGCSMQEAIGWEPTGPKTLLCGPGGKATHYQWLSLLSLSLSLSVALAGSKVELRIA